VPPAEEKDAAHGASLGALKLDTDVTDKIFFDTDVPGFGLRVRASGARTWIFQYKVGRRTRRLVLGNASAVKPARAREIAGELHARVRLGGDPAAEKRRSVRRSQDTFGYIIERFVEQYKKRPRTRDEVVRHLSKYAAPLHSMPVDSITLRDVADLLSLISPPVRRPRTVSVPRYPPSSAGRCERGWRSPIPW
jgi:hypothetical protein